MKIKDKRMIKILKIAFGIMILAVVLLLVFGELYMPKEDPEESGECVLLNAGWERVYPDGRREAVTLPVQCDAKRGEVVRVEKTLPQNQSDTWLCMRSSQQDMHIYVEDELRKEYTTKGTRLFENNSASAFVFFPVTDEDAGKVLAIETVSNTVYTGRLNEVYMGDKYDIVSAFVKECAPVILTSFCLLILSAITFVAGCVLRFIYHKSVVITYLGLGILQISLMMITESKLRQFFLPNSSIAAQVGYLLTMLIPYPFIIYLKRIQKGRYEKGYNVLLLCVAANFVLSVLLQLLNIVDFVDSTVTSYGLILVMVMSAAVTILLDIRKGRIAEYGEVIVGIFAMIIAAIWETYITFAAVAFYDGGITLSIGLIILLFMSGIKTARDMHEAENEKQIAILAGEAKAQFLANMSHEIRTPINTIIGMNEMILRENEDEEIAEYARNVQSAGKMLLGLVNDILDFSKIDSGKMTIIETEYDLSKMLIETVKAVQIKADKKNLKLCVNLAEDLPSVLKGDEIRIRQILDNLLSNAVKYTHEGTIFLTVKPERSLKRFMLCISVEDTGIGIKEEDMEKLFDSFKRLEERKNRHIEGTGLGLNITKQLVDLMEGRIEVKSEYAKGSSFTVKIPQCIADETPIGSLENLWKKNAASNPKTEGYLYAPEAEVLVVDDNKMNLNVVKTLLKRTAIRLTLANSGTECLELCKDKRYDLILMDHMMPDPDGIETLHLLRKDETSLNRETKVIVFTANAIVGMAENYKKEGFADYISKPIMAGELENMLYRYLPDEKRKILAKENTAPEETIEAEEALTSCLDKKSAMTYCADSEEIYQEMLATYYEQSEEYRANLSEYYKNRDWKQYKVIIHALKSTSILIGALDLSKKAKELENAAKECDEEILLAEHEKFMEEYQIVLNAVCKAQQAVTLKEVKD